MNIGFVGTRFAGVDGVSLETQKLAQVFREMGHDCFFCAGELDGNAQPSYLIPKPISHTRLLSNSMMKHLQNQN